MSVTRHLLLETVMKYRTALLATGVAALLAPLALQAEEPAAKAAAEKTQKVEKTEKTEASCNQLTGSRIKPARSGKCESLSPSPLRSYSKEDLERTGETDLNEALRKVDPAFR
jgi:hypothetical protein